MNLESATSWGDVSNVLGLTLGLAGIKVIAWLWDRLSARFEPVVAPE